MKFNILKVLCLSLVAIIPTHMLLAQTASILPPAKTTFLDNNGKPLVGGKIDFYVPGTSTRKMTWQDAGQTTPNTNPVTLDAAGRAIILGDGSYRQVVKDKNGNLIWDQITSSTGGGSGGGGTPTVGDGDPVGMIKVWGGFVAPFQYAFAYGQEFNRASYPELFAAITSEQNVTCSLGSPTLTSVGDTSQLPIGAKIESSCLNPGSTIASKTTSTVTANTNAIISTTTSGRFFPYGNGDGNLTFNLPDLRGRVVAGRDNMGGIAANRLTSTYFANASAIGAAGGSESFAIAQNQLPNVSPTFSGTPGTVNVTTTIGGLVLGGFTYASQGGGASIVVGNNASAVNSTGGFTPAGTISSLNGNVSQQSIGRVQATQTENYIIKILPDSNPNTFFGVASIGGMTGVITCGFGVTCAGNSISAVSSTVPPPSLTQLGGIYLSSAPSLNFTYGVDAAGNLLYAQPGFGNLSGTIAAGQIANNTITNAMLNTGPALSVVGNSTNATANRTDIAAATDGNVLRRSGTSLAFGAVDLTNSNSVTGVLPAANLPTATSAVKGIVQGDGSTLTISTGTISCTTGSSSQLGCLKPDGSTITSTGGTLTAVGAVASSIGVGTTGVTSGTNTYVLTNNSGTLGNRAFPGYNSQTFTTGGTFTTPSNSTTATVYHYRIQAGGGGGGGSNGAAAAAGGGGGGAYAEGTFTGIAASTGITITVGNGGSAGVNTGGTGGSGGTSSIGSPVTISCSGGAGGTGTTTDIASGGNGGTCTGTPSILSISGQKGLSGTRINNGSSTVNLVGGGTGAPSMLGVGGVGGQAGIAGTAQTSATGYGAGGGGSISTSGGGSAGSPGIVIIDWVL